MKLADWVMQGVEFANCNCIWGCPCQFNGAPTHGNCRAYTFVHIDKGRFNDVPLDGLRWGILAAWPGPIHLGNGTFQSVVDERADKRQRDALEAVSHGRETEPGKLIWQVFSTTVTRLLPTVFKPIELKEGSADFHADKALARLKSVVARFADAQTPYRSLVSPMWKARYGDYDHLARVAEWSAGGEDEEAGE